MRHLRSGRKLNRDQGHRKALFRNMAISLLKHERIETTDAKAKDLRGYTEKLISLGKKGDLHSRRIAAKKIHDSEVLQKLFDDIAKRNDGRNGGYTRVIKSRFRRGDCAQLSVIELVEKNEKAATKTAE
jgi:large subunit ribosomal protein L17